MVKFSVGHVPLKTITHGGVSLSILNKESYYYALSCEIAQVA